MILDEATSDLDSESELLVQKALANLLTGRTAFVIAHRLSTIRRADKIVVLEDGVISESGTHQDLLARGGTYARLYHMQFSGTHVARSASGPGRVMKAAAARQSVKSMTGYAEARRESDGWLVRVSLRSVNHRFLDLRVRLPEGLEELRAAHPPIAARSPASRPRGR